MTLTLSNTHFIVKSVASVAGYFSAMLWQAWVNFAPLNVLSSVYVVLHVLAPVDLANLNTFQMIQDPRLQLIADKLDRYKS